MKHFVTAASAVILVISILPGGQGLNRYPRRTGDQAPNGTCVTFKWGGISGSSGKFLHWYVCCNNCDDVDKSCDSTTYHSASTGKYCDSCGVDNAKGNARNKGIDYTCGGCSHQNQILTNCKSKLRRVYEIPGFCWAFAKCFEDDCKKLVTRQRRSDILNETETDSCFDLECNNGETTTRCPIDCCGTVNEKCDWRKYNSTGDCIPACCSESTCCNVNAGLKAESSQWLWIITLVARVGYILCWQV